MNTLSLVILWYAGIAVALKVFADADYRFDQMSLGEFVLAIGILVGLLLFTLRPNPKVSRKRVSLWVFGVPLAAALAIVAVAACVEEWKHLKRERIFAEVSKEREAKGESWSPFKEESATIRIDQVEVFGIEFLQKETRGREVTWFIQGSVKNKSTIPLVAVGLKVKSFKNGVQRDYEVLSEGFRPGIPCGETRAFSRALRIESGDQFGFEVVDVNVSRNPFARQ